MLCQLSLIFLMVFGVRSSIYYPAKNSFPVSYTTNYVPRKQFKHHLPRPPIQTNTFLNDPVLEETQVLLSNHAQETGPDYAHDHVANRIDQHNYVLNQVHRPETNQAYRPVPGQFYDDVPNQLHDQFLSSSFKPFFSSHAVPPSVLTHYRNQDVLGRYSFGYDGDSSSRHETKDSDGTVRGSFSYLDPFGKIQLQNYIADARGFRVAGTNLPVGPARRKKRSAGVFPASTGPLFPHRSWQNYGAVPSFGYSIATAYNPAFRPFRGSFNGYDFHRVHW